VIDKIRIPDREIPMDELLAEYLPILIFLGIAIAIAVIAVGASYIVVNQRPDVEKNSTYECGFDAFEDSRGNFDVRFYLVLFPWAVSFAKIGVFGFLSMMVFLAILTVGFVYEWKKGALEWE
jgi:NADH-quinone oxidoreductase subunit A